MDNGVVIGYCRPQLVEGDFLDSITNVLLNDPTNEIKGIIPVYSGPQVDVARNSIVFEFLEKFPKADWLLMLDCDMKFDRNLVRRLLVTARTNKIPFIGGLAFKLEPGIGAFPTIYDYDGRNFTPRVQFDRNSLVKCDGTGAACTLVHRVVYHKVAETFGFPDASGAIQHNSPWYEFYSHNRVRFGEDLGFCLRVRSLGFPIHVDTSIKLGHIKPGVVDEDQFIREQAAINENSVNVNLTGKPTLYLPTGGKA